jgi:hypothetical protein
MVMELETHGRRGLRGNPRCPGKGQKVVSRFASLATKVADRLRGMDVSSLAYFHTDHFEPWRPVAEAPAVGPESAESVHDFCRATERIEFARRLTLFYKPHLNHALQRGGDLVRADPDDLVGFMQRSEYEERIGREAMREIASTSAHDIQLHLHHEHYTVTTQHSDPEAIAWFASPLGRSLDERRLEVAIRLSREAIARETGRRPKRWFFVHGQWALNASDRRFCTITNEIEVLLRNGCLGDFTFPADYQHTNPSIRVPYLCRPFNEAKAYDSLKAEPEIACANAQAARSKFFIWASPARARQCSLDYMFEANRRYLEHTERAAMGLIDGAYVEDGRLFIKTHAHSMHRHYFEHAQVPVFPHQHPAVQRLLWVIFDAAVQAGLRIEFLTVPEVYDLLISAKAKPETDLAAIYRRPEHKLRLRLSRLGCLFNDVLHTGLRGR